MYRVSFVNNATHMRRSFSTSPGALSFDYPPLGNPLIDQASSVRRSLRGRANSVASGQLGIELGAIRPPQPTRDQLNNKRALAGGLAGHVGSWGGRALNQRIVIPLDLQAFEEDGKPGGMMLRHSPPQMVWFNP